MKCPSCGHKFTPLPKLTEVVKVKILVLLDELEGFAKTRGEKIKASELQKLVCGVARSLSFQPWEMQTPRNYLRSFGVVRHLVNGVGGEVRMKWVIVPDKIAEARKALQ